MKLTNNSYIILIRTRISRSSITADKTGWLKVSARSNAPDDGGAGPESSPRLQ